jgi:hypothetical protein
LKIIINAVLVILRTFTGAMLIIVASTRNRAIQTRGLTSLPTDQRNNVLPSS